MNYLNIYKNIIKKAKNENRIKRKRTDSNFIYYENHHIIPKSLCKNKLWVDFNTNKVLLTSKEHFICHLLLTKIYPSAETLWAFRRMMDTPKNGERIYSKMFDLYRGKYRHKKETLQHLSIINQGKHLSEEHKKKISISRKNNKNLGESYKGEKNGMYGKHLSLEARKKISDNSKRYWKEMSKEDYDKLMNIKRLNNLGEKNGMYGKKHTKESRDKMSSFQQKRMKNMSKEERSKMFGRSCVAENNPMSKKLKIQYENNIWIIDGTLQEFCKTHNVPYGMMLNISKGYIPTIKSKCYGWKVEEI